METIAREIEILVAKGWAEENAVRSVAAKYDVPDYEIALYLLDRFCEA